MANTIRVIHADDHSLVRQTIKRLFASDAPHIQTIGEASSFRELFAELSRTKADVLLLDGQIIGGSTSEFLPIIRKTYPDIKIILLWLCSDIDSLTSWGHMLDGQVNFGYCDSEEIINAVEAVMQGEKYFVLPVFKNK